MVCLDSSGSALESHFLQFLKPPGCVLLCSWLYCCKVSFLLLSRCQVQAAPSPTLVPRAVGQSRQVLELNQQAGVVLTCLTHVPVPKG